MRRTDRTASHSRRQYNLHSHRRNGVKSDMAEKDSNNCGVWGEWMYGCTLKVGLSLTPRPLQSHGKCAWCPLSRRLNGPQSRSERFG
jgi:hypothetical protein